MHGFPIVTSDVTTGTFENASGRAPIEHMANSFVPSLIATFISIDAPVPQRATPATICGTLRPRDQPITERHLHLESPDNPLSPSGDCSLEEAAFPYLFPFVSDVWNGAIKICPYLRKRMGQLFSPFTLDRTYLLMYHACTSNSYV